MEEVKTQEHLVIEFDDKLFAIWVEKMIVQADGGVNVVFKDGRSVVKRS